MRLYLKLPYSVQFELNSYIYTKNNGVRTFLFLETIDPRQYFIFETTFLDIFWLKSNGVTLSALFTPALI